MEILDLAKILRVREITPQLRAEMAEHLFPDNRHPDRAFTRVIAGTTDLNSVQISKLAICLGVKVGDLFDENYTELKNKTDKSVWKIDAEGFTAYFDSKSFKLRVLDKRSLIHEESIVKQSIPLSTLINKINKVVTQKQKQNAKQ